MLSYLLRHRTTNNIFEMLTPIQIFINLFKPFFFLFRLHPLLMSSPKIGWQDNRALADI